MPKRLMIVDDSPLMRAFVRRTIAAAGLPVCQCLEAGDGLDALAKLRSSAPVDLILTDINMPVMDGQAFLRELKQDPGLTDIPVIVVSTDSTCHRVDELLRLGATNYVRKPFAPERLGEVLQQVFEDDTEEWGDGNGTRP